MKRRILAALAVLLGEPIPHQWTECPNAVQIGSDTLVFGGGTLPQKWEWVNDWETIS